MEWPNKCKYWKEEKVRKLLNTTELRWLDFRVRCCAWGMTLKTGPDRGKYPTKVWRLMSTMPGLDTALNKQCPQDHEHGVTQGGNTAESAKYPPKMAAAFHRHYRTVDEHGEVDYLAAKIVGTT